MSARCICAGEKCRLSDDDSRHGTCNGYQNLLCRCEPCRAASSIYQRQARAARIERGIPDRVHGTAGGYGNWGCRCESCTRAWTLDTTSRARRRKRGQTRCATGQMPKPKRRTRKETAYGEVAS